MRSVIFLLLVGCTTVNNFAQAATDAADVAVDLTPNDVADLINTRAAADMTCLDLMLRPRSDSESQQFDLTESRDLTSATDLSRDWQCLNASCTAHPACAAPGLSCYNGTWCLDPQQGCRWQGDCCGAGLCTNQRCCLPTNQICQSGADCCSGRCSFTTGCLP